MTFTPAFGRIEDRAHTEAFFAAQRAPSVTMATADWTGDDNADVDLCAIYEAVTGRKWNSLNQHPRGFCVGFGNGKCVRLSLAVAASLGKITYPGDAAIEPIYGGMRFEIGYKTHGSNLYRQDDGGVGTWAAEWLLKWGILLMQKYGDHDLSRYDLNRCSQWGNRGVPDDIEDDAKLHPLDTSTRCDTAEDCWKMIGQLYPLVHCSNQGFEERRDANGICSPTGRWAHCALWDGRFTLAGGRRVLRYDNSWFGEESGRGYLGEPRTYPLANGKTITLNGNQFFADLEVAGDMCRSGRETYAFAGGGKFEMQRPLFLI